MLLPLLAIFALCIPESKTQSICTILAHIRRYTEGQGINLIGDLDPVDECFAKEASKFDKIFGIVLD